MAHSGLSAQLAHLSSKPRGGPKPDIHLLFSIETAGVQDDGPIVQPQLPAQFRARLSRPESVDIDTVRNGPDIAPIAHLAKLFGRGLRWSRDGVATVEQKT